MRELGLIRGQIVTEPDEDGVALVETEYESGGDYELVRVFTRVFTLTELSTKILALRDNTPDKDMSWSSEALAHRDSWNAALDEIVAKLPDFFDLKGGSTS